MDENGAEGALAEFAALRAEIDSRSRYQQQILALQLTLTSAMFAFGLSRPGLLGLMLIIPLSSYLLCARYIAQRTAIRWAARYISEELSPRVAGGLGWTSWSQAHRRPDRLLDWFGPLLLSFPGASALALAWTAGPLLFRGSGPSAATGAIAVAWLVGLLSTTLMAYLLLRVYKGRSVGESIQ